MSDDPVVSPVYRQNRRGRRTQPPAAAGAGLTGQKGRGDVCDAAAEARPRGDEPGVRTGGAPRPTLHTPECVVARDGADSWPTFAAILNRRQFGALGVAVVLAQVGAVLGCPHPGHDAARMLYGGAAARYDW